MCGETVHLCLCRHPSPEFESHWRVVHCTIISSYACNLESRESRMAPQMDIFAAFFGLDDSDDSDAGSEAERLLVN